MRDDDTALNRATYDRIAGLYAAHQDQNVAEGGRFFAALEDAFLARLPVRARLADLGCGPARDGARFLAAGHTVVGLDLSSSMVGLAAPRLGGRVLQGDLRALPLEDACLDGVWNVASLLHVPDDATEVVLREFRRVLRRDGVLALVTALGDGSRVEPVPYAPDERRWFVYRDADRLVSQVSGAGFDVELAEEGEGNRRWFAVLAGVSPDRAEPAGQRSRR